jgi:tRNA pseudouridine38-40 synthase
MDTPLRRRIRLLIAYDGGDYSGWQRQNNGPTIQGEIEACLATMTRDQIFLHGAGRTDAGVHAEGMVAHFDCRVKITDRKFLNGLNSMLPGAIRILDVSSCKETFHSRFSATAKRYQYHICRAEIQPPHLRLYSLHHMGHLDLETMTGCLERVQGRHDFSSFENSGSRDRSISSGRGAVRTIYHTELIESCPSQLSFEFIGDGFLRNMVRNLVGTILEAGKGRISQQEFGNILRAKDRSRAGATAPAHGLFLKEVMYDNRYSTAR